MSGILTTIAEGLGIISPEEPDLGPPPPPPTDPATTTTYEPVSVYARDFIGPLPSAEWYGDRKYEDFKGKWAPVLPEYRAARVKKEPGAPKFVRLETAIKAFKKAASGKKRKPARRAASTTAKTLKNHPNSRAYRRFLKANKGKKGKAREKWTSKAVKAKYGYKAV